MTNDSKRVLSTRYNKQGEIVALAMPSLSEWDFVAENHITRANALQIAESVLLVEREFRAARIVAALAADELSQIDVVA